MILLIFDDVFEPRLQKLFKIAGIIHKRVRRFAAGRQLKTAFSDLIRPDCDSRRSAADSIRDFSSV